jgi:integrase
VLIPAPNGARINLSSFHRDVREPVRTQTFPEGSTLRRVRRHDLRHSAITAWLNSGVLLKTAQQWSGHRQLSVLLDTYLGVMTGDAEVSLQRVEDALDQALHDDPDGDVPSQVNRKESSDHEQTEGEDDDE